MRLYEQHRVSLGCLPSLGCMCGPLARKEVSTLESPVEPANEDIFRHQMTPTVSVIFIKQASEIKKNPFPNYLV